MRSIAWAFGFCAEGQQDGWLASAHSDSAAGPDASWCSSSTVCVIAYMDASRTPAWPATWLCSCRPWLGGLKPWRFTRRSLNSCGCAVPALPACASLLLCCWWRVHGWPVRSMCPLGLLPSRASSAPATPLARPTAVRARCTPISASPSGSPTCTLRSAARQTVLAFWDCTEPVTARELEDHLALEVCAHMRESRASIVPSAPRLIETQPWGVCVWFASDERGLQVRQLWRYHLLVPAQRLALRSVYHGAPHAAVTRCC